MIPILEPAPMWARAMPNRPDPTVKITEAYARHVAKDAFFWAWPMVNMYSRRLAFAQFKETVMAGPVRVVFLRKEQRHERRRSER